MSLHLKRTLPCRGIKLPRRRSWKRVFLSFPRMSSSFERLRDENVRKNRELLMALGLDAPIMPVTAPKSPAKKKAAAPRKSAPAKRRLSDVDGDGEDGPSKAPRVAESPSGTRRSSRNSGRPRVSYTDEIITRTNSPPPVVAKPRRARDPDEDVEGMDAQKEGRAERVGNRLGSRVHNPCAPVFFLREPQSYKLAARRTVRFLASKWALGGKLGASGRPETLLSSLTSLLPQSPVQHRCHPRVRTRTCHKSTC